MNYDFGVAYVKDDYHGIKVTMNNFRGRNYIHIREYIFDPEEEIWFPTKKGYAINADDVDSIINLLQKASFQLAKEFKNIEQLEFNFKE